ncbi:ABC transporter permease subunit, partial [Lactococcus garvieae]|uniref:ABC transporter permease subunit n=1 Tax=Lactococcus garvieae TaxID=1363 RepID=UPI00254F10E6
AIGLFIWTGIARQVRNMTLSLKEREFVLAAKTLGASPFKIMVCYKFKFTINIFHFLPSFLIQTYTWINKCCNNIGDQNHRHQH